MKSHKLLLFLLAGALLGQTLPTQGSPFNSLPHMIIGGEAILDYITTRIKMVAQNAPEISTIKNKSLPRYTFDPELMQYEPALQKYLKDFALRHHNLENVTFLPGPNRFGYAMTSANEIKIPSDDYAYLLCRMHPEYKEIDAAEYLKECNTDEKIDVLKANSALKDCSTIIKVRCSNGTSIQKYAASNKMDSIESSLHHELGHIKHKSFSKKNYCNIASAISLSTLSLTVAPPAKTSFALQCATGCAVLGARYLIALLYAKYDETRADDTIPNDARLLKAKEKDYRNSFNRQLDAIRKSSSNELPWYQRPFAHLLPHSYWEKYPHLTEFLYLTDDHPSDYFRAERFKARLAALENNNKPLKEISNEK
jgi:hypothetical protein